MWLWIQGKIEKKIAKWNKQFLSLAGRIQICQKILASYSLYFTSVWLFSSYQVDEIQKKDQKLLVVKWERKNKEACCEMGLVLLEQVRWWTGFKGPENPRSWFGSQVDLQVTGRG